MAKSDYFDESGTRPPIPDSIARKNIKAMGKAPFGYKNLGKATKAVEQKAASIVFGRGDFGYEEYAQIDGVRYFFRIEPHYHPASYVGGPHGWHKGVSTYVEKAPDSSLQVADGSVTLPETVVVAGDPPASKYQVKG